MLNLNDVRVFVQVVEKSGFAPAARALRVPKSTLSKRVAELERSLDVVLVRRTTRTFQITPVGLELYRQGVTMVQLAQGAEDAVRGRLVEPSGDVRVTCSVPTAQTWLAGVLPKVAAELPSVRIALHATDRFVDIVRDGFDIAVRDHFAPLPDSSAVRRRVTVDRMVLVASPGYLRARGRTPVREPRDLARHRILGTHLEETTWKLVRDDGRRAAVRVTPHFAADETTALLAAAKAGLGIASLPARACDSELREKTLVRVAREWRAGDVTTTLLLADRRVLLPAVRAVAVAIVAAGEADAEANGT